MPLTPAHAADPRAVSRSSFLARSGWSDAACTLLAGDASFRKYWRIARGNEVRVLMDAPPEHEDITPFMNVTERLAGAGLRVADLHAHDAQEGWLLLEDLGDASFTRLLQAQPALEKNMYEAAIDALVQLHHADSAVPHGLPPYDEAVYLREAALLTDWYLPQHVGMEAARKARTEYVRLWREALAKSSLAQQVLVHRDYHADNLLWQQHAEGVARVGMLDFQDALHGDAAYDVVSLLEDARRDVAPATVAHCLQHYLQRTGASEADFMARYALLGAQRNAKIIGIFARLAVRDGKPHYLGYLPRVWGHFLHDLQHPALAGIKAWVDATLPPALRTLERVEREIGGITEPVA